MKGGSMFYRAEISKDTDGSWYAGFPDCPGASTSAATEGEAAKAAGEVLVVWLEAHLQEGQVPPLPQAADGVPVRVPLGLALKIQVRAERHRLGWTQAKLAEAAGVVQQQVAKLEHPDQSVTVTTAEKITEALQLSAVLSRAG